MQEFRNRRISIIGAARSGIAATDVLTRLGADVLLSDSKTADQLGAARREEIAATGALFVAGADVEAALPPGTALVVTSPGVPKTAAVLQEAVRRGIPVWSEIELAYRLTEAPIVAVTGTNGKTTTTLLIAAMLQAAGKEALVAGNVSADEIKRTLVDAAFATSAYRRSEAMTRPGAQPILVVEVSSFQLEWVETFAPHVGVLTNITPDHLNRHADFTEYAQAKARLFAAQRPDDWAILNADNSMARTIGMGNLQARRCWFTGNVCPPDEGPVAWLEDDVLTVRLERDQAPIALLRRTELPPTLPGRHSVENTLAASAAALALGAEAHAIAEAVRLFPGVAHRMEFVAEIAGVRYINNSMCTNVAASISSLAAMDRPTILIAGGADKALDFAPLVPTLHTRAKQVILIGSAADKLESAFLGGGYNAIERAPSLEAAVSRAHGLARPGDAVLLSPGCASFDMFTDFEARGAAFRQAVRALDKDMP